MRQRQYRVLSFPESEGCRNQGHNQETERGGDLFQQLGEVGSMKRRCRRPKDCLQRCLQSRARIWRAGPRPSGDSQRVIATQRSLMRPCEAKPERRALACLNPIVKARALTPHSGGPGASGKDRQRACAGADITRRPMRTSARGSRMLPPLKTKGRMSKGGGDVT